MEYPLFAKAREDGAVVVDPDAFYPIYLDELGMKTTKFSLEVARRCMTADLLAIHGPGLHLVIAPKKKNWALRNFPEGQHPGENEQTGAMTFRAHYKRILKKRKKAS